MSDLNPEPKKPKKQPKEPEPKKDNTENILAKKLEKQMNNGYFVLGKDNLPKQEWIATGSVVLDYAISSGNGYPCGKFIEIFGGKSVGKSLLSLIAAAKLTKEKKYVLYCDLEDNMNTQEMCSWAEGLGVDMDYFIIMPPATGEEVIDQSVALLKEHPNVISLMIIDSIAALSSGKTIEKKADERTVAEEARLVRKWINQLMPVKKNTCIMMINQQISNIGTYGGGKVTKGGTAPAYFASVRLELKGKPIPSTEGELKGPLYHDMSVYVEKNKIGPPKLTANTVFDFWQMRFDAPSEILPLALEKGLITKKPPMYYMDYCGETLSFKGQENLKEKLREDQDLLNFLIDNLI